ncbi:hypothetical protein EAH89_11505 [Roseomonas nepalensis]|uniref:Uncharacterized protein n=1 Tax=Muricoccus nepalensis TaxID=1854500 RepID=A0A502G6S1_9PROT|nr:hypothetical protein [Roseomonas nepalensis]TPG57090.1 hypothetical protein EAH89_11505 [Roseomonas nepalensis]
MAMTSGEPGALTCLRIGNPQLAESDDENRRNLYRIVALIAPRPPRSLNVVLQPGKEADDGAVAQGSDQDATEAWPEKGLVGGQPGPGRNGRKG